MLPNLPKKNKKIEANFGTKTFRKWVTENVDKLKSGTFELKQTETDTFNFNSVKEKQIDSAKKAKWSRFGYLVKVVQAEEGCPDYIFLKYSVAYIVVKYPKGFVVIDIDKWVLEKSKSKSLTWKRACEIKAF